MVHCDYSAVKFKPITHPKFTKYIGVSQHVCDIFTNLTGIPCELCYNHVYLDKPKKVEKKKDKLHIIYAGRLTEEKQGWLIDKFSNVMDKSGIDYDLTIYSNKKPRFYSKNIILKEPKLDLTKEMTESSFNLITSKAEAYCLSAVESLVCGTPLICTDLPVFKEIGINETNSIKIDGSLQNFNPNDLLKEFNFTYKPPKDNWDKFLPTEKTYNPNEIITAKALHKYKDIYLNENIKKNDEVEMPIERASYLESKGLIIW
jgi:glycosyltransferase involved in cell wall biosynthesis